MEHPEQEKIPYSLNSRKVAEATREWLHNGASRSLRSQNWL